MSRYLEGARRRRHHRRSGGSESLKETRKCPSLLGGLARVKKEKNMGGIPVRLGFGIQTVCINLNRNCETRL